MRLFRSLGLVAGALAFVACGDDDATGPVPTAGLRYVNLVADTIATDFRVIDIIEDSPQLLVVPFRGVTRHAPVQSGEHQFRVFLSSSDIDVATTILVDMVHEFEAGRKYTVLHHGYANRAPQRQAVVIEDADVDVPEGQFALRVIHADPTLGTATVALRASATATEQVVYAELDEMVYGQVSEYVLHDVGPINLRVLNSDGSVEHYHVDAPAGIAPSGALTGEAGTTIEGSILTVVLAPPSIEDSGAGTHETSEAIFLRDNRPGQ